MLSTLTQLLHEASTSQTVKQQEWDGQVEVAGWSNFFTFIWKKCSRPYTIVAPSCSTIRLYTVL